MIDIHTHIYPQVYLNLLRSRKTVPYLLDPTDGSPPRLIILPSDDDPNLSPNQRGRPIDASYSSIQEKLKFMDIHNIQSSVVSLANPWLDFLSPEEGIEWAPRVNDELENISKHNGGQLYAFGTLPLSGPSQAIVGEIHRIKSLQHIKGVIMGTSGLGQGLDDASLDIVYHALHETQTLIFLHPHYGLPSSVFGPRSSEHGHILPLSLGFPMETAIAFTRMFLSGVFDRFPRLKILIAHAGGTVPFLHGRINSCVEHERHYYGSEGAQAAGPKKKLIEVLKSNVWLDAVVYSETGVRAAVDVVGIERVLFGTDHPFFPPLEAEAAEWKSVRTNVEAVRGAYGTDERAIDAILGQNAADMLGLPKR
ncbi:MAG: hypothetical protein Q9163_002705 [Psora crenata]